MPSIPQSLLWISLVVLWLFVLVPMLALATAVLAATVPAWRALRESPSESGRYE